MSEAAVDLEVPVWRVLRRAALVESWRLRLPASGPVDVAWRDRAACSGLPLSLFFEDADAQVLAVCASCPVRAACAQDAFAHERTIPLQHIAGVRGGLYAAERVQFLSEFPELREIAPPVAVCGTNSGYHRHRHLGEPACEPCRAAHTEAATRARRSPLRLVGV